MSKRYIKLESGHEVAIGHPDDGGRTLTVGGETVRLTVEDAEKLAWYLEADADGVKRSPG